LHRIENNRRSHSSNQSKYQVSTDSEDNYLSTNRYSVLTNEALLNEQQLEETSPKKRATN
jgi:hypothetical protein